MDLSEIRQQIDEIDQELVELFCRRMNLSAQVADYKKANNLPIFVPARERAILQKVAELAGPEMENYTRVLYSMLFELRRRRLQDLPVLFRLLSPLRHYGHCPRQYGPKGRRAALCRRRTADPRQASDEPL